MKYFTKTLKRCLKSHYYFSSASKDPKNLQGLSSAKSSKFQFDLNEEIRQSQKQTISKMKDAQKLKNFQVQLFRHQQYSFRRLQLKNIQTALVLLSKEFDAQEPLTNAIYKQFVPNINETGNNLNIWPEKVRIEYQNKQKLFKEKQSLKDKYKVWIDFWGMFIQDSADNRTSVAVFDLQNGEEMIGISIAKDFNYVPQCFEQKYMRDFNYFSPVIALEEEMITRAKKEYQKLLKQKKLVLDIWGVAIKKEHMGKRLLHKMMLGNEILGKIQGFQHGFCFAGNFKTGVALQKQNFMKISDFDCKEFEYMRVKPFSEIEKLHRRPSLSMKNYNKQVSEKTLCHDCNIYLI